MYVCMYVCIDFNKFKFKFHIGKMVYILKVNKWKYFIFCGMFVFLPFLYLKYTVNYYH